MNINFCPHCMHSNEDGLSLCAFCGKPLHYENEPHQLPVNTILRGRYVIGKCIGQGGFGITYIGAEIESGERIAIKEFYPNGLANRHNENSLGLTVSRRDGKQAFNQGLKRFVQEAELLSRFADCRNIVQVRECFEANGTAYIVMEYIDGKSLQQLLNSKGRLGFSECVSMLVPVMQDLGRVHRAGLIHRDISPSNIMLQRNGLLKLLDFGTARYMSREGENSLSIVLKPGFAPEEQYRSHGEQGPWTDVYALCATIYKLITGQTPENALNRLFEDTLQPPSALGAKISPRQEAALMRGLAVRRSERTASMEELIRDLSGSEQEKKSSAGRTHKLKEKLFKNKNLLAIGAAVLAGAVTFGVLLGMGGRNDKPTKAEKEDAAAILYSSIAAGESHSAAVLDSGTVVGVGGSSFGQQSFSTWKNIIGLSGSTYCTVGLKADGTVVVSGPEWIKQGVDSWRDVIDIDDNGSTVAALHADGTVSLSCPDYFKAVKQWRGIKDLAVGNDFVAGLRDDGTVLVCPWTINNEVSALEAAEWTDITAISGGSYHLVGLRADGTVVSTDPSSDYSDSPVQSWKKVVKVVGGCYINAALTEDGRVLCDDDTIYAAVKQWRDIVDISMDYDHILGLCSDGTVLSACTGGDPYGYSRVEGWNNIKIY